MSVLITNHLPEIVFAMVLMAYVTARACLVIVHQKVRVSFEDVFWAFSFVYTRFALVGLSLLLVFALIGDIPWPGVFWYILSYAAVVHLAHWVAYFHQALTGELYSVLYDCKASSANPWRFRFYSPRIFPNYLAFLKRSWKWPGSE